MRFYSAYPVRRFGQLRREMDRLFSDFDRPRATAYPPMNMTADEDGVTISAELPGVDPAALEVSAVRDTLTVRGELPGSEPEEGRTWHRRERRTGPFSRTIQLPYTIDAESVKATCKNGVLRITLSRPEVDQPRQIEVTVG